MTGERLIHELTPKIKAFRMATLTVVKIASRYPVLFISKVGVGSILGHFPFVGWVELSPSVVGFLRLRRTNLHLSLIHI